MVLRIMPTLLAFRQPLDKYFSMTVPKNRFETVKNKKNFVRIR